MDTGSGHHTWRMSSRDMCSMTIWLYTQIPHQLKPMRRFLRSWHRPTGRTLRKSKSTLTSLRRTSSLTSRRDTSTHRSTLHHWWEVETHWLEELWRRPQASLVDQTSTPSSQGVSPHYSKDLWERTLLMSKCGRSRPTTPTSIPSPSPLRLPRLSFWWEIPMIPSSPSGSSQSTWPTPGPCWTISLMSGLRIGTGSWRNTLRSMMASTSSGSSNPRPSQSTLWDLKMWSMIKRTLWPTSPNSS